MAQVSRLAGAILAETEGRYFLVGDLKEPCDWAAAGFSSPGEIIVEKKIYVEIFPVRDPAVQVNLSAPVVKMDMEGEVLAKRLVDLFVIDRNGSVSERLWMLATSSGADNTKWLGIVPMPVWNIVRESVLRCL